MIMKGFLTIIFTLTFFFTYAQSSIKGTLKDNNGEAVPFANVAIYNSTDSNLVKVETSKDNGSFQLSNIKAALLPVLAAIGGMVFPALIYIYINYGTQGAGGWGIPMATDIAFAISALVLLGKRVPPALVTFLVALAIVHAFVEIAHALCL